jgi:plastocyanin domain-containing protein
MNKIALIIIAIGLVIGIGIVLLGGSKKGTSDISEQSVENSKIRDGVQYITIMAKGGYSPSVSNAKAGIPTKLIIKTNSTYDCSASLVIRSVGFQKILRGAGWIRTSEGFYTLPL